MTCVPPRDSGKGDRAFARWAGRLTRGFVSCRPVILRCERSEPRRRRPERLSSILRGPRCARAPQDDGEQASLPRSRDAPWHPRFASRCKKALPFASLQKRREGGRRSAHQLGIRPRRSRTKACCGSGERHRFLPHSADRNGGALALRRPPRSCAEGLTPRLGLGPRFLELPGANGRTLPGASAASTSQTGSRPAGRCPRPPGSRLQAPPPGTAPAPPIGCHRSTSLRWASFGLCNNGGDVCQGQVSAKETTQGRSRETLKRKMCAARRAN